MRRQMVQAADRMLTSRLTSDGNKRSMARPSRTVQKDRRSFSDWAMSASEMRPSVKTASRNVSKRRVVVLSLGLENDRESGIVLE